jgi:hypothetical protein
MRRWIAPDRDIGTGMFLRNVAPSAEVFQRFQRECAPASATGSLALYGSIAAELPDPSGIFSLSLLKTRFGRSGDAGHPPWARQ